MAAGLRRMRGGMAPVQRFAAALAALTLAGTWTPASGEDFVDSEFNRSGALGLIQAQYAYQRGYTGKGVVIAIVDTGLDVNHPEFAGRISPWLQNYVPGFAPGDVSDVGRDGSIAGHGTHVAGLAAAARDGVGMQGVAYNATVLPLRSSFAPSEVQLAFDRAIAAGAKVLNGSFGPMTMAPKIIDDAADPRFRELNPYYAPVNQSIFNFGTLHAVEGIERLAAADVVMVFAAGNDRQLQPGTYSASPSGMGLLPLITPVNTANGTYYTFLDPQNNAYDRYNPATWRFLSSGQLGDYGLDSADLSSLQGALIAVVATEPSGKIAEYSNWCGMAKAWCLAAPGGGVGDTSLTSPLLSTYPYSTYRLMQGTSMASPVVAGAAAVLREAFPYMSARQIIEVILTTANSTGIWADSDIYGHGMLDLGKAVRGPAVFGEAGFPSVFSVNTQGYNSVWSNDISGTGGLAKAGAGVLVMTGANSYTGATVISGGKLVVNGSIASSALLTIGKDAALGGSGVVGNTIVYGRVQPGNSVGTLRVSGDYVQHAGSLLELELSPQGITDKIVASGNVDIQGGGLQVLGLRGSHLGRQYAFLEAGGSLSGAFDETNLDGLFIDLGTRRSGSAFMLSVERNSTPFASLAQTDNQRAVANAIESQGAQGGAYDEIVGAYDAAAMPRLYESLTGELYASTQSALFDVGGVLRQTVLQRTRQALLDPADPGQASSPYSGLRDGRGVWAQVFGNWGRLGASSQARGLDRSLGGVALGGDLSLADSAQRQARAGLAFAYTNSTLRSDGALGRVHADGYHTMAYAGLTQGPWSLRGGLAQSWYQLDTRRSIEWTAHTSARSKRSAQALQAFVEAGHGFALGGATLEPYAGLAQTWMRESSFDEDNSAFGLRGDSRSDAVAFSTLGLRLGTDMPTGKNGRLKLEVGLGWRHAFGDVTPVRQLRFASGNPFEVVGVPLARNALVTDMSLDWAAGRYTRIGLSYAGQWAGGNRDHGVQASLRWAF